MRTYIVFFANGDVKESNEWDKVDDIPNAYCYVNQHTDIGEVGTWLRCCNLKLWFITKDIPKEYLIKLLLLT